MTSPFITNAFSAGVLSPSFYGRSDLDKYDLGLALAKNFTIDYRGGAKNRSGTRLRGTLPTQARFAVFSQGYAISDILVIFLPNEIKFFQSGAFLPQTIVSPYGSGQLPNLYFTQRGNRLTISAPIHPVATLTFDAGAGAFTYTEETLTPILQRPTGLAATASGPGDASYVFAVTWVDKDGKESIPSRPYLVTNSVNYTVTQGSCVFSCTPVTRARSYRFYRSIVVNGSLTIAQNLGFIGESAVPRLTDSNITADFSRKPPSAANPFAPGQILDYTITNPGSGYPPNTATLVPTSGGLQNFIAHPVVSEGQVVGLLVDYFGEGFATPPTFTVGGGGTGATIAATEVSPMSSVYPRITAHYQQRRIFASTNALPAGIWGTELGSESRFNVRQTPLDTDSFSIFPEFVGMDSISHVIPTKDGLFLFHPRGIWKLTGAEGSAITPSSHQVEPQTSFGSANVLPVDVDTDIIYVSTRGTAVYALSYNLQRNGHTAEDISIFASHFFKKAKPVRMAWQEEPDRLLWVLLDDGRVLSLTYVRDQGIYAWTEHDFGGTVKEMISIRNTGRDVLFLLVDRGGTLYLEDMQTWSEETPWFVDCGVQTQGTDVSVMIGLDHLEGQEVSVWADGDVYTRTVEDGTIYVPQGVSRLIAGLPYTARLESLPLAEPGAGLENKRKRPAALGLRVQNTRGLRVGIKDQTLYEVKDKGHEDWGDPIAYRSGIVFQHVMANWERDQQVVVEQPFPLPAEVLGLVSEVEL